MVLQREENKGVELTVYLRKFSVLSLQLLALIVQAAGSAGATVLYSEDLAEGQSYGAVRVVNPLR
jgi:predicted nucleic acid-binding protein